ncbi:hypothetical protein [Klebsiella oxytoca]|uniref:hypothetical protein n=1 Tax=Klebsiella oxytoca TaxID=571 RepID=UPI00190EDFD5|nr:hypothetical protein [Klebsiella oxytoca]
MKGFQGKYYASAEHYGKPTKPEEMGRYNDLSGKIGVCYFAENSLTALAENYGRMYHHANGDFAISGQALTGSLFDISLEKMGLKVASLAVYGVSSYTAGSRHSFIAA